MGIVDRFTRDKVSRWIWGGLTLACLGALLFADRGESKELTDQVNAAQDRAALYANTVIWNAVQANDADSSDVHFLYRDLYVDVQGGIFTDPSVALVRIWDADGILRFSTEATERELIGQQQVTGDPGVEAAVNERRVTSRLTTAPFTRATTGTPAQPTQLLQIFTPLMAPTRIAPLGAVQIDFLYDVLADESRSPWLTWQIVFAGLAALFALLTVLSLRRSVQPIGSATAEAARAAAVAKTAALTGAESDLTTVDRSSLERTAALEAELDGMRDELQASREQLRQAEEAYRYLEVRMRKTQEEMARAEDQGAVGDDAAVAVAEAEERARSSERRIATLESHLAEAEARARAAESATTSFNADSQGTDVVEEPARRVPTSSEAPAAVTVDANVLARLEQRIDAAERRAAEAEERLTELTPEATDLRARLARTAARKKLRPEDMDEPDV